MKSIKYTALLILVFLTSFAFINTPKSSKAFEITKNLEIFTEVYKNLNKLYVDDLNPATTMNLGLKAIMKSLDPYTRFYSESEIENYRFESQGKYDGIGARIQKIDDAITIIEPYEGGPAVMAGLRAGDQIMMVDGINVAGKSNEEVKDILLGTGGSEIVLGIKRFGSEEIQQITVQKGEVNIKNVPYHGMVRDGYGYIGLTTFTQNAGNNVRGALLEMMNKNEDLKGVILDLRGNGGGLLSEAINVSNVFLPKGKLIATTKGKEPEEDKSYRTRMAAVDEELPVVVLINGTSASASEIVSGAIQDYDRGVLLGERTYGKGLVQVTRRLPYNNQMKLTISKYYIPSGRCIQSVEYDEEGEPVMIADSLRSVFKTANGREVLDGGGVKPDVELSGTINPQILQELEKNHMIFNYANNYYLTHDTIDPAHEFDFTDYEDWKNYLKDNHFDFHSEQQIALDNFEKTLDNDHDFKKEVQKIRKELVEEKNKALDAHKQIINTRLGMEIASRYYLQKGKILYSLQHDPQIDEAIQIMKNKDLYQSILESNK
ncbi:S41 family peptidase [Membranicola marinus]|uniref:S41 family peptidase n=1 Tax=Membranihabitans marinus TaxID=1227546 RepID=A0A953LCL6_9BACT|nr:S41 family peptidase [Membranihabitans marinus]MBY5959636.1 S41 family peptidase [Membranihabitans marinus]